MIAQPYTNFKAPLKARLTVAFFAVTLCLCGIGVLYTWHHIHAFGELHRTVVAMSFNTAICMILLGIALLALINNRLIVVKLSAIAVTAIGVLSVIELGDLASTAIHYWFISSSDKIATDGNVMSTTTAVCLTLAGISLLLFRSQQHTFVISIAFLNLVTLTIAVIALLGRGIGLLPTFIWLGIKMAPHTATCISLFSLSIIFYIYLPAIDAFNRLNFFKRIVIGFGFMAILVIAIGSIALMQIHSISSITHKLYENPLQTNNAAQRIKNEINTINRSLKNIAIQQETAITNNIPEQLDTTIKHILSDLEFIRKSEPTLTNDIDSLIIHIHEWKKYVLESCVLLDKQDFESFAFRTVYRGQEQALVLESMLEKISMQAQQHIAELNSSVARTEEEAKQLVLVIVIGFLLIGVIVSAFITRSLTSQLQKIRLAMLAVVQERLNSPIPFLDHDQEVGDMAKALAVFQESFSARRDLETRLRQVIEAMPNGIIMVNNSGIIEILNAQAEKIFGYDRSELLGKPVEQLIPQKAAASHAQNRNSFFADPSPRMMGVGRELFGLRRDGKEFPLEIGLAPVNTKDGLKVLASIVDITERRNSEIALNESRERLELTTRINQIGIWEYNVDDGLLIWNDAMFEIYGRKKDYFTYNYQAWKQCIHQDDLENFEQLLQDSIQNLSPYSSKFRIIQPDGSIKYVLAKAKVEHDSKNKLRVLGTTIDTTREELALAQLHNLEVLRSAIVESSEDAIISKTTTGIITSWNLGAQNMFGYKAAEAIGKPIKELIFPEDLMAEEDMLLTKVRSGLVIKHFETRRRCKDGRIINVSITMSPIKDASGTIVGISAIKRDITESIENAEMLEARTIALEYSNQELERSNKELETFAYVASHDLKSPLRGIAQLSTWIEEDLAENDLSVVAEHTKLLRNRIQRMEKLLDDLLVFYRAGKAEGAIVDTDVNQLVTEIFEIQNNKPGLRLEILSPLPQFKTLSTPFELVIRNLFSNAIKHHDKSEGVIQVSYRTIDDKCFEFSICDDGPGIPEKFHNRVFGMFQTLKPRDELEGSGMGLALIKKIVETYGGKVSLASEGRGACFSFTWPINIRRRQEND